MLTVQITFNRPNTIHANNFDIRTKASAINSLIPRNGSFTKPESDNENETDTENKCTKPKGNLCCHLSLCSVNTPTQSYPSHFYLSRYRSPQDVIKNEQESFFKNKFGLLCCESLCA